MATTWLVASGIVLTVVAWTCLFRAGRRRRLASIRALWGKPLARVRKMDAIASSHRSRVADAGPSLDDRTWADLDLDAVFVALDRTTSTLGQHALYHRLRTAPTANHLDAFEALVSRFSTDGAARERAQLAVARLQDPHGYDLWWLSRPDAIATRAWYRVFPMLAAGTVFLLLALPIWPSVLPALVVLLAVNVVVRLATDSRIGRLAAAFRQLAPVIATGESLQFVHRDDIEPIVGSLRAEVDRLRGLKTISRWISGDPLMLSTRWTPLATLMSDVVNAVYEYLNLVLLLDANGVYFGVRALRVHGAALLRVVSAIGEVDAAISVSSYRASRSDWTRPRFHLPGAPTALTDVRHPLVADAVPNSITVGSAHGILITGSNMSGKSTCLRTVGVTVVMAQTINTCLATKYEAPILNVRSCIGRADDLLTGKSYYIVEVEALLDLVKASTDSAPHLFLLDELFRGTNAIERIAAGQAVLCELVADAIRPKPHVVLAATHDGELVDLLPGMFAAYHFGDAVGLDGLVFDYHLQAGPATTRNAIALLRLQGAPESLVSRAETCAAELDVQRGARIAAR